MRRTLFIIALLLMNIRAYSFPSDTLRVLAIGNSFSQDALEQNLGELTVAAGKHIIAGNLHIGGCSLERHLKSLMEDIPDYTYSKRTDDGELKHWKKVMFSKGILDEPWDVVTFQQASPNSGQFETFEPFIGELIQYIKKKVPTAKRLMWQQTWAYQQYSVKGFQFKYYGSRDGMYDAICSASEKVCRKYKLEVIPSGTAIQNLKSSFDGDNCHRDASHMSFTIGRYTVACTWFEALFEESVVGNGYEQPYIPAYRSEVARNAAHMAVIQPFSLTDMSKAGFGIPEANYDDTRIKEYTLPDPLEGGSSDGLKEFWEGKARTQIVNLFRNEVYGKAPLRPEALRFELMRRNDEACHGKAVCKEIRVYFSAVAGQFMDILLYTPKKSGRVPVFLGINEGGNYAISDDPWITLDRSSAYVKRLGIRKTTKRGTEKASWPVEAIIDAGYGLATFHCGDVAPDYDNSFNLGVIRYIAGRKWAYPADNEWGNISAWAWGLSRALDYLETDVDVDAGRVALVGNAQFGKAALWAGAQDERFAVVIANSSGRGGASISRRRFGETVEMVNKCHPHWFCDNFKKYNANEETLPVDQHELLALIAPRPLYLSSNSDNLLNDPEGERIALYEAMKIYRIYGEPRIGRHVRGGAKDINPDDWTQYLKFAGKYMQ